MSAEGRLRDELRQQLGHRFGPGEDEVMESLLDEVMRTFKERELLITGGTILEVESARPQSGVFTDPEWRVRLAQD
jgi:hypothetical protein